MLLNKMTRAALLDIDLYEEVEADVNATTEALLVVLIASIAGGIGASLAGFGERNLLYTLIIMSIFALISWMVWAGITYWVGTTLLKGPETSSSYGELLRTIGFSASPGVLRIFIFIPILGQLIGIAVYIWMLIAMIIAVRQALDFTTGRAIGTCIIGWIIQMILVVIVSAIVR
jgi:hypothetical protein